MNARFSRNWGITLKARGYRSTTCQQPVFHDVLLDQLRYLLYKVSSLFMDDHTPPLLFDSHSLMWMPVQTAPTNQRVQRVPVDNLSTTSDSAHNQSLFFFFLLLFSLLPFTFLVTPFAFCLSFFVAESALFASAVLFPMSCSSTVVALIFGWSGCFPPYCIDRG